MLRILIISSCLSMFLLSFKGQEQTSLVRQRIDLSGVWKLQLDPDQKGIKDNWQNVSFKDEVKLPGSLEENKKGNRMQEASSKYLNQTWKYVGAAWYQKEIEIPQSWQNKNVQLVLERTKVTQVWLDKKFIGRSTLISAPQVFDLSPALTPGKHTLTIMVDNSPGLVSVGGSHALSEHTQTNWNGIVGEIHLQATEKLKVNWVKVKPLVATGTARVLVSISNPGEIDRRVIIAMQASLWNSRNQHIAAPIRFKAELVSADTVLEFNYSLGKNAFLWSEFSPDLYKLSVNLIFKRKTVDSVRTDFGLREFRASGTQFRINDVITFLRGKNDGCIFPLTGYPPTDSASWRRLYRTAKSYGINHYRFHSYTPPEAAFEAADVEGVYIQTELPNWANLSKKDMFQTNFQYREGRAILDTYGNHPSFVMFTLGNELAGDSVVHNKLVRDLRKHDSRPLFAQGTNAFYADPRPGPDDDFWATMRTGKESAKKELDVRGSFATTEDGENGILNAWVPSTRYNFSSAIKGVKLPVIGHETGQFQVYPDFREIPKYKGILRASNFEIFKKRLEDAGMGDQASDFFRASGKLTALLYREEIEMAFRTPGFGGFQLLDLQDYPGQGTALIGLLNAFMESKGLISPEEFRQFNNDVVIQLLMDKYTWTNDEIFKAEVQLVNYSDKIINNRSLSWTLIDEENKEVSEGTFPISGVENGKIRLLGKMSFPLSEVQKARKLSMRLEISGSSYRTEYPVWVYPAKTDIRLDEVLVSSRLDETTIEQLDKGARVLLFPDHQEHKNKTVGPQFISEFWNWLVFKGAAENMKRPESAGTLGILTDPAHPVFKDFPTEFHSNWQWWSITKNARPLILDQTESNYRPIVQVIDNIDRNHKLGMIFEFKAGKGSLLVSMANLPAIIDKPEARQLYHSILSYMASDKFNPQHTISLNKLKGLLTN